MRGDTVDHKNRKNSFLNFLSVLSFVTLALSLFPPNHVEVDEDGNMSPLTLLFHVSRFGKEKKAEERKSQEAFSYPLSLCI